MIAVSQRTANLSAIAYASMKDFYCCRPWSSPLPPRRRNLKTSPSRHRWAGVNINDGRLDITFKNTIENAEINGIEIIPAL
jgi:hypothetical protein